MSKTRFATQLYSRLTNANPELVLVFMQAGSKVPPPPHAHTSAGANAGAQAA